jgi:SAM-dependent methyltransferase
MSDHLQRSWGAFTRGRAHEYLRTYGAPAATSRVLTAEVIADLAPRGRRVRVVDLGCGNGQMLELFRERGMELDYLGVDFSEPLLDVARERFADDPHASFVAADVNDPSGIPDEHDVALYSHVVEILSCPEGSLARARELARHTVIRFFEPPEHELDVVELREMEIGDGTVVPYLRRKMARDSYRLMLARLGVTGVDLYRDEGSADQVHVLRYPTS